MDQDLQDLLALWRSDHDPGEVRRGQLLDRLRGDDEFRRAFVAEIHLLGLLRAVQSAEPRWLRLEDEIGWSAKPAVDVEALAQSVVAEGRRRIRARRWRRNSLALAACALFALGLAYVFRPSPRSADMPPARSGVELATILKSEGVRWDAGDGPFDEGHVVGAGRLRFSAGRLTLGFYGGVALTVEGPADLELVAANRVYFHHGKLRARVPHGAEGFTVLAAGYEVVDMGTEFGVSAEPNGKPQVMVFDGEAAVSVLGQHGRSIRSTVVWGERSVEIDARAGQITDVAHPKPEAFAELGNFVPVPLELSPEYAATVRAANPWGYWRFEQLDDGRVPNEISGGAALLAQGAVSLEQSVSGNHCARFGPGDHSQAFVLDGTWTPPRVSGYAIELWAQADLPSVNSNAQTALVSVLDQDERVMESHLAYLELAARGRRWPHEPCAVRFLDRWPPARRGGTDVFSRRAIVPCFWRHIVAQKSGDIMELFVDGELVGTTPLKSNTAAGKTPGDYTTACRLLIGRLKQRPLNRTSTEIRDFEGRLDELAVYDRALSITEIRSHSQLRGVTR